MKLVTFERGSQSAVGELVGDRVSPLSACDMLELIEKGSGDRIGEALSVEEVRLLAPVPVPGNVVCIGLNYRDHATEAGMAIPDRPVVFSTAVFRKIELSENRARFACQPSAVGNQQRQKLTADC